MDSVAPLCSRTITERSRSPWFSDEVKTMKRSQRQAERKWRKTKLQVHRDIYIKSRNEKCALILKLKQHFYINKFESVTSSKELYQISNELFGITKSSPLPDGNELDICENLITFFCDKITTIRVYLDKQPTHSGAKPLCIMT